MDLCNGYCVYSVGDAWVARLPGAPRGPLVPGKRPCEPPASVYVRSYADDAAVQRAMAINDLLLDNLRLTVFVRSYGYFSSEGMDLMAVEHVTPLVSARSLSMATLEALTLELLLTLHTARLAGLYWGGKATVMVQHVGADSERRYGTSGVTYVIRSPFMPRIWGGTISREPNTEGLSFVHQVLGLHWLQDRPEDCLLARVVRGLERPESDTLLELIRLPVFARFRSEVPLPGQTLQGCAHTRRAYRCECCKRVTYCSRACAAAHYAAHVLSCQPK